MLTDSCRAPPSNNGASRFEPKLQAAFAGSNKLDRSISIKQNKDGIEELIVDNQVLIAGRLAALGGVDHDAIDLFVRPDVRYIEGCPPASYDTAARVELLDSWGVDAGVVFPTIGILWDKPEDPKLAMAHARAYNNWQWDFASPAKDRIIPIARIPLYDVDLALTELKRCIKLNFKGMFVAPEPVNGKRPSHPDFDPLWHEIVAADLPVCVHLVMRFNRPVNSAAAQWWDPTSEPINPVFSFGLGGTMQLIPAVAALVYDRLFDRFPKLKFAIVESGAGYAAYLMDRLAEKYARFGAAVNLKRKPSEYIRENIWFVYVRAKWHCASKSTCEKLIGSLSHPPSEHVPVRSALNTQESAPSPMSSCIRYLSSSNSRAEHRIVSTALSY